MGNRKDPGPKRSSEVPKPETTQRRIGINDQLNILVQTIKGLASAHRVEEIQEIVAHSARKLTDCDGATIVFRDGVFCSYVDEDAISPLWKGRKFPLDQCISGWVMKNATVAVIPDIYIDPRIPVDAYRPTFVKSLVMVPIVTNTAIGAIGNYWKERHETSPQEIEMLQSLADTAAKSLETAFILNDLERRVEQRTSELEAFSYSVSHDLRAPLRAIDGFANILLGDYQDKLDENGRHLCAAISTNARKMNRLIEDLLRFSRSSNLSMNTASIDMKNLVISVFKDLTGGQDQKKVEFTVGELPHAIGDPALIHQVWVNLIGNALKFSSGKACPRIEVNSSTIDGETIYSITDNGAGFDMKYAQKLFGVFQRLHTQEEFDGTGVGLAITQRIIQRHGGRIWAKSEIEKGAIFSFTLSKKTC